MTALDLGYLDARRLSYFLAIVQAGSATKAAAELRVAQPSLSQALRALERELGTELFDRVGRGLRLTDAGRALVGPGRQALLALEQARDAVRQVSQLETGTLALAALPTLAVDPLAALLGRFTRELPGISVSVRSPENAAEASALVREGECEIALAHLPAPDDGLLTTGLSTQQLLLVLPPNTPLADGSSLSLTQLADVPLVLSPRATSTRVLLEGALEEAGVTPRVAIETESREAIVPLVLAGAGTALLPAPLAREAERRGALVRSARPRIARQIGLIRRPGPLSPAARAFVELALAGE
jgi:DNA-binding transcriptional LysR family regulator